MNVDYSRDKKYGKSAIPISFFDKDKIVTSNFERVGPPSSAKTFVNLSNLNSPNISLIEFFKLTWTKKVYKGRVELT